MTGVLPAILERVLLVVDATSPLDGTRALVHRVAESTGRLHVLVLTTASRLGSHHEAPPSDRVAELRQVLLELSQLRASEEPLDASVDASVDPSDAIALAQRMHASIVVVGPWPAHSPRTRAFTLQEIASRAGVDVLALGARCDPNRPRTGHVALSIELDPRGLAWTTSVVRALPDVTRVTALVRPMSDATRESLESSLAASLPTKLTSLVVTPKTAASLPTSDADLAHDPGLRDVELVVIASDDVASVTGFVSGMLAAQALEDASIPVLLVRRGPDVGLLPERIVATDALRGSGESARVLLERVGTFGRAPLAPEETFVVIGAEARGELHPVDGVVEVPIDPMLREATRLAFARSSAASGIAVARVVPESTLVFVDSTLAPASLAALRAIDPAVTIVFVRLRPIEALDAVRARVAHGSSDRRDGYLVDASALLADSFARDVPPELDSVRLMRVALRATADGHRVLAVVTSDESAVRSEKVATFTPSTIHRLAAPSPAPPEDPRIDEPDRRLVALTDAELVAGHRIRLELDNTAARAALLRAVDGACERVHLQSYIVEEDATTLEILTALRRAALRGVEVRVLVDSLYGRHASFGVTNALLASLDDETGVEVRAYLPVSRLPSLQDLKQRNHRKCVIVDGTTVLTGGRNLGAPYYRGLDEVQLTRETGYHEVPWLDATITLEGPLVERFERAFLADWQRSGGGEFEVASCAPAGGASARLVLHDGLVDAHTLDAQLELVHTARASLVLVNTFPLVLELQSALIAAVRRGVRVRMCFGSVRPRWGADEPFRGGAFLGVADDVVRSRLDPVLRAGAEGWEYALPHRVGWATELERVFPHVHAKLLVRDDDVVAVGSANLDVTSAYWENEALLLVHDRDFAAVALDAVERAFASARRVDPSSASWRQNESIRGWLGRNWSPLFG